MMSIVLLGRCVKWAHVGCIIFQELFLRTKALCLAFPVEGPYLLYSLTNHIGLILSLSGTVNFIPEALDDLLAGSMTSHKTISLPTRQAVTFNFQT